MTGGLLRILVALAVYGLLIPQIALGQGEPPEIPELRPDIFPAGAFSFTAPSTFLGNQILVQLKPDSVDAEFQPPEAVQANAEGNYEFRMTCWFMGEGTVWITDPDSGSVIAQIPVTCGTAEPAEAQPQVLLQGATAAAAGEPIVGVRGFVDSLEVNSTTSDSSSDATTVATPTGDQTRTFTSDVNSTLMIRVENGLRCTTVQATSQQCCAGTEEFNCGLDANGDPLLSDCSPVVPSGFNVCVPAPVIILVSDMEFLNSGGLELNTTTVTDHPEGDPDPDTR